MATIDVPLGLEDLPALRLGAGTTLSARNLGDVRFVHIEEGLAVVRTLLPRSARRAIMCHAAPGALILRPSEEETLVALTDVRLVTISAEDCDRLLARPATARLLVEGLAETLRQKHASIARMARLHHVDRVREKLIELARDHGRVGRDGIRLDFPLTHDLLGEMTGSARETVTRALDELHREGFVVRRGRSYTVCVAPEELGAATP